MRFTKLTKDLRQTVLRLLLALLVPGAANAATEQLKLPKLGESSTSMFSTEYEYQLGRTWLRIFRSQVSTDDDPLLFTYLEDLIYKLATHSQLEDRRIDLVVVDNPSINAFAVPGGVIGVNNGLLNYAQSEDELATVLAHEIAHLSQRHFSRSIQKQQAQQPLTLAAMLAGFVLLATTGSDVGLATLTAAQAAAQNSALRYSRGNEQEADRVGMQTMVESGFDPHAAPAMFERMLAASRYSGGAHIPEFLRTHPLSENRIADTRNRALQHPKTRRPQNLTFHLMRARVINKIADTPERAVQRFRGALEGTPISVEAARYGLSLALLNAGRASEARLELDNIWSKDARRLEYILLDAEIDMAENRPELAVKKLAREAELSPGNHPLIMTYANALMKARQPHIAEEVLLRQSKVRGNDPALWYLLAEIQGLSGNIIGLHQSRAEYFILNGNLDQADKQLEYALKSSGSDYVTVARLNQRRQDIMELRQRMDR